MASLVAWSLRNGQFSEGTSHRIVPSTASSMPGFVHSLITHARSLVSGIDLQIGSQKERKRKREGKRERGRERECMEARPRSKEEIGERMGRYGREFFTKSWSKRARWHALLAASERPNELGSLGSRWPVNGREWGKNERHDRVIVIFADSGSRWFTRKAPIAALTIGNHDTPPCALTGG